MGKQGNDVSRRGFLGTAGAATAGIAAGAVAAGSTASRAAAAPGTDSARRPNFLFILADDMGWGDISRYGRRDYRTPHIDSIGHDGITFSDGYANSCLCTPTREGFFTGRYQQRIPLAESLGSADHGIPAAYPTIADVLGKAGYDTALVGKWHCGLPPKFGPNKSGFDYFYGFLSGAESYYTHIDGGSLNPVPDFYENEKLIHVKGYNTRLFTDKAIEIITDHAAPESKPFYLSLHYNAIHWPWESPESGPNLLPFPFDANNKAQVFAEMTKALDVEVGRVLAALHRLGLAENTLVVFTSDNGGERYGHEYPFQGQKGNLYEGGIRVPMMARWTGQIAPGQVTRQVAITMDWTATLAGLAGASAEPGFGWEGRDLTPQLIGGAAPVDRELYWRFNMSNAGFLDGGGAKPGQVAVRYGKYKYLNAADNIEQLYDLSLPIDLDNPKSSPNPEAISRNLSDHPDYQPLLAALRAKYRKWDKGTESPSHFVLRPVGQDAHRRLAPGGNGKTGGYPLPFQQDS